ncbi:UDP-N-acetylmuramoylalanine--D-glutamate ligase MurD [Maioricimonas rarisocia]|uniref:UDP-N-acetylmuramoylalanine--D-glutamate ligase n=1 Tax=Maioricimonas rarisocia TaxID=2528026 RepID=A0A517Z8N9_9PLAN|nr:UDP-N-acetylmuramoyl-L-alanine--D-glutamate ligase [Maioricimonas rarisocia]QDU38834.1 UDP-N-acetylmuramoylalanine--D-glutamate ligase MurD [Maioricimonas rarisocia]
MADPLRWLQEIPDFDGMRVTVMGLGTFGGGVGVTRYLVERGAIVTVTDLQAADALAGSLEQLRDVPPAALHLGGHQDADFENADLVVVSPAVPLDNRWLRRATAAGALLTSEINLFCLGCPARVIGVTGSSGKSTTAALIAALLQASGRRSWLGGNIGESLLPRLDEIAADHLVVLELSSFQLEPLDAIRWSPDVAVVTNFAPNHLDRHGTLAAYEHAKQTILRWQQDEDIAVLNAEDGQVAAWPVKGRVIRFGESVDEGEHVQIRREVLEVRIADAEATLFTAGAPLQGRHNRANIAAAVAAVVAATGSANSALLEAALSQFRGLPHRLEAVGAAAGRLFVNDSKSTTPEATVAALEAFRRPVMLIAGGADKGVDLVPLAREIASRAKGVALIGAVGPELERLIAAAQQGQRPFRHVARSLEHAVRWAFENSDEGDVILLSPGCASFGWFSSYVDRGQQFVSVVERLRLE